MNVIVECADSKKAGKAWSETSREVGVSGTTCVRVAVQRFSLVAGHGGGSGSGCTIILGLKKETSTAVLSLFSVHEREPPHNNAHARSATPTRVVSPSQLLIVGTRNDNAVYHALGLVGIILSIIGCQSKKA